MNERTPIPRCRHCLAKAAPENGRCPFCGIRLDKLRSSLSRSEKKIRFHARCIRMLAMLHLIGGVMGILMMPDLPKPAAVGALAVINMVLAYGLIRYAFAAYRAATAYYFLIGMVNIISIQHGAVHLGGIALTLIALYIVGNRTAKAIFERRLPDLP